MNCDWPEHRRKKIEVVSDWVQGHAESGSQARAHTLTPTQVQCPLEDAVGTGHSGSAFHARQVGRLAATHWPVPRFLLLSVE